MKRTIFSLIILFSIPLYGQFDTDSFIKNQKELIINDLKETKINGLAIAFFDKDRIIWSEGFGHLNTKEKGIVNNQSIFAIHSMSKTFTATAVMFAVQDGIVDLDTPITEYIPNFKINSCFEPTPESKITLRYLLGNAAGLTHEAPVGNNYDASFSNYKAHFNSIQNT